MKRENKIKSTVNDLDNIPILSTVQIYHLTLFYILSCSFAILCSLLKSSSIIYTFTYLFFHTSEVSAKYFGSLLFYFLYSKLFLIT